MTEADKVHFTKICTQELTRKKERESIGTYKEKALHSALKCFICEDEACHEIKIYSETPPNKDCTERESGYIADVLHECDIYEIQNGSFYPLINKIKFYLEQTCYNVIIIKPVATSKWINWINPETSEVETRNRSPKKESERDVLPDMFWLIPYLNNRRLTVRVIKLEIEEFRIRNGWGRDGKRGSQRYERIPTALCGIHDFSVPADYIHLLPPSLPDTFVAADFERCSGYRRKKCYAALKVLCTVGLIAPYGKLGRAVQYIKK